jgi:hypothetical protein
MYLLSIIPFIYEISVNLHKIVLELNLDTGRVTTFALSPSFSSHPVVNAVGPTGDNNPNFTSLNADILGIEFNAAKVVV